MPTAKDHLAIMHTLLVIIIWKEIRSLLCRIQIKRKTLQNQTRSENKNTNKNTNTNKRKTQIQIKIKTQIQIKIKTEIQIKIKIQIQIKETTQIQMQNKYKTNSGKNTAEPQMQLLLVEFLYRALHNISAQF